MSGRKSTSEAPSVAASPSRTQREAAASLAGAVEALAEAAEDLARAFVCTTESFRELSFFIVHTGGAACARGRVRRGVVRGFGATVERGLLVARLKGT